ncbi:MAG: T9SS type A sorting domain-containing protein [Ignavibacteriaceae bacterium]|nr:T9SS type A sorting domain-containing protein [Ignavibacteriaceae bacterium]
MKKFISHIFVLIFVCRVTGFAQQPVVKVSPAEMDIELFTIGEVFVHVENISGFRAYSISLSYDSQKLRCLNITRGNFFSGWNTFFFTQIDSNANILTVDEAILGTGYQNGSGDLFKVQMQGLSEGDVNIDIVNSDLRDTLNNSIQVQTEGGIIHILGPTSVTETKDVNKDVLTAHPNPFNSYTRIEFNSNKNLETELAIFSITGEKVFFSKPQLMNSNNYSFIWNGKDTNGNTLPSGIYILTAGLKDERQTFKLIMLK